MSVGTGTSERPRTAARLLLEAFSGGTRMYYGIGGIILIVLIILFLTGRI
jgi:hypothetical protein